MQKVLLTLSLIALTTAGISASVQEMEEVEVTCSKCKGKGTVSTFEKCQCCDGKGMIEEEIHNGNMRDNNCRDGGKPTKTNRKRCSECAKSVKKGMVKAEASCDKCGGSGKVTQQRKITKKK